MNVQIKLIEINDPYSILFLYTNIIKIKYENYQTLKNSMGKLYISSNGAI